MHIPIVRPQPKEQMIPFRPTEKVKIILRKGMTLESPLSKDEQTELCRFMNSPILLNGNRFVMKQEHFARSRGGDKRKYSTSILLFPLAITWVDGETYYVNRLKEQFQEKSKVLKIFNQYAPYASSDYFYRVERSPYMNTFMRYVIGLLKKTIAEELSYDDQKLQSMFGNIEDLIEIEYVENKEVK